MKKTQLPQLLVLVLMTGIGAHALAAEPEVKLPPRAKHGLSEAKALRLGADLLEKDPKVREILAELDLMIDEVNVIYESYLNVAREDRNSSERAAKIKERDEKLKAVQVRRAALVGKYEECKRTNPAYQALQKRAKEEVSKNKEATKENVERIQKEAEADEN